MEDAAWNWPVIGLILAGELLFSLALAALVRRLSRTKMSGQTYWMVVMGVAGVVLIAGGFIGWLNVAFLAACFGVAGLVMGVEYFSRQIAEHEAAQKVREESLQ